MFWAGLLAGITLGILFCAAFPIYSREYWGHRGPWMNRGIGVNPDSPTPRPQGSPPAGSPDIGNDVEKGL